MLQNTFYQCFMVNSEQSTSNFATQIKMFRNADLNENAPTVNNRPNPQGNQNRLCIMKVEMLLNPSHSVSAPKKVKESSKNRYIARL